MHRYFILYRQQIAFQLLFYCSELKKGYLLVMYLFDFMNPVAP